MKRPFALLTFLVVSLAPHPAPAAEFGRPSDEVVLAAAHAGMEELVETRVRGGANVDSIDHRGRTPLMLAARENHLGTVKILLDLHADAEAVDYDGLTAVTWATRMGHLTVVHTILERMRGTAGFPRQLRLALGVVARVGDRATERALRETYPEAANALAGAIQPAARVARPRPPAIQPWGTQAEWIPLWGTVGEPPPSQPSTGYVTFSSGGGAITVAPPIAGPPLAAPPAGTAVLAAPPVPTAINLNSIPPPAGPMPVAAPALAAPPYGGPALTAPAYGGPSLGGPGLAAPANAPAALPAQVGRPPNWPLNGLEGVRPLSNLPAIPTPPPGLALPTPAPSATPTP